MSELDLFCPEPREIIIRGEVLAVLPLVMRQISPFSRAIDPALAAILSGNWLTAAADHSDAMQKAVGIATGKPEAWLSDLYAHEFLALFDLVLEVNLDFFGQRVIPVAARVGQRLVALMMPPAGPTFSPGLSSEDTSLPN